MPAFSSSCTTRAGAAKPCSAPLAQPWWHDPRLATPEPDKSQNSKLIERGVAWIYRLLRFILSNVLIAVHRGTTIGGQLIQDRRGVNALEFAVVGPVFLMLMFAIIELGVEMTTQMLLDHSVDMAARQVQIGNITTSAGFVTSVCDNFSVLVSNCSASTLQVYATSGSSFSSLTVATVNSGKLSLSTYSTGTARSDVFIEVVYNRPYLFGMLSNVLGETTNSLLSSVSFQSEPY